MCVSPEDEQNKTWPSSIEFSKCEARSSTQPGGVQEKDFGIQLCQAHLGQAQPHGALAAAPAEGGRWETGHRDSQLQDQPGTGCGHSQSWLREALPQPRQALHSQMFYGI